LYHKLAQHAGVDGFMEHFALAIDLLTTIPEDINNLKGVLLLPCYLLKPVQDGSYFTFSKTRYALVLGTPQHLSQDIEVLTHTFKDSLFTSGNKSINTDCGTTTYLEAFRHFLYKATSAEMVITDFRYFLEDGEVVIVDFGHLTEWAEEFA
jgi:hypothetical protein